MLIRSNINFGNDIEEEGLLYLTGMNKLIKQHLNVLHLWQQLLNNTAESLINSMIINTSQMVSDKYFLVLSGATHTKFLKEATHILRNFI